MLKTILPLAFALSLVASPVFADNEVKHFQGVKPASLPEALAVFSDYNKQLEAILAKGELDAVDMHNIHELTYTLENALEKIDDELDVLSEILEDVHQATEHGDTQTAVSQGKAYLDMSRQLIE
jgi:hypothetical protein